MGKFSEGNHADGLSPCHLICVYQSIVDQAEFK